MHWYLAVLKKYAVFNGRARRKEYWMFFLFNLIISFMLSFIEGMSGLKPDGHESVFANIYSLVVLLPSIAVGVRRMHDSDRSGWWLLLPVVNLIFLAMEGTPGDNKFGADPKTTPQASEQ